ncbi:MAG: glycosyltransferase family A protein [Rhodanobacter sp.]
MDHSFIIPAYGRSSYLEDCLESLAAQTLGSPVIVCTSTPFDGVEDLCHRFNARLQIHSPNRGIGADWNAALVVAGTELVTLAHQDDIYLPEFAAEMVAAAESSPESAILFSDADEITSDGKVMLQHRNTSVKRLIGRVAFAGRPTIRGPVSLRLLLGLGNPITCPAVTIRLPRSNGFRFREDLRTNMDWLAWIELAKCGGITRVPKVLMQHRAHDQSATARCLSDGARSEEDRLVFDRMWPRPVASILAHLYQRSYAGYSK